MVVSVAEMNEWSLSNAAVRELDRQHINPELSLQEREQIANKLKALHTMNFIPKGDLARVKYFMARANEFLNHMSQPPSAMNHITISNGASDDAVCFWTALMLWGEHHPKMKFGKEAFRGIASSVELEKGSDGLFWWGSKWRRDSMYNTLFKPHLTQEMLAIKEYPEAFAGVSSKKYKTIYLQERYKIAEAAPKQDKKEPGDAGNVDLVAKHDEDEPLAYYETAKTKLVRILNAQLPSPNKSKAGKLLEHVERLKEEGKQTIADLTDVLNDTVSLLNHTLPVNDYRNKAQKAQGSPSLGMQILGGLMIGLAILVGAACGVFVSVTCGALVGAGMLAAGVGLFSSASRSGLSRSMNDVLNEYENTSKMKH